MTPDLILAIQNHSHTMARWWVKTEYIKARKAFLIRHPVCTRCGRPATTPGHSHEDYRNFDTYIRAVDTDKCVPLCAGCNLAERKGMKPCPECVSRGTGKIHYISQFSEQCRWCLPEQEQEQIARVEQARKEFIRSVRDLQNQRNREYYRSVMDARKAAKVTA